MTYEQSARADLLALPQGAAVTPPRLRVVLRRLADHANDQGEAWPSAQTLAGQDMDEKTARNALKILDAAGLIRKLSRGARGYRFALCDEIVTGRHARSESGRHTRSRDDVTGRHARNDRATHPSRPGDTPAKTTKNQSGTTTTRHQQAGTAPRVVDAGGGDALTEAGGFDGDLAGAIEALADLRVNRAEALARQAGSERAVLYAIEQAKAPGVKTPAALAATLIRSGERPPAEWRTKAERARTPAQPSILGDRSTQAADHQRAGERDKAEKTLIGRYPDIALKAAAAVAEGGNIDARTLRKMPREKWAHCRITRQAVLAAIEAQTGETAQGEPSNNGRPRRAAEQASC